MRQDRSDHILVWMRDGQLAARVRTGLEAQGLSSTWAASLPEAIATVDQSFPQIVACTLEGYAPSLMDIETLLAYLALGHQSVSLPLIPIWALTSRPTEYAAGIAELGLPVRLLPLEAGAEGLLAEIVHNLGAPVRHAAQLPADSLAVLFLGPERRTGFYVARYLRSRGIPTLPCTTPGEALQALAAGGFQVLVADLPQEKGALAFLEQVRACAPTVPVVILTPPDGWALHLAPQDLPANLNCTLGKPLPVETLEACLRRLLRIPPRFLAPSRGAPGAAGPPFSMSG